MTYVHSNICFYVIWNIHEAGLQSFYDSRQVMTVWKINQELYEILAIKSISLCVRIIFNTRAIVW